MIQLQSLSLRLLWVAFARQKIMVVSMIGELFVKDEFTLAPEAPQVAERCLLQMSDRIRHDLISQHRLSNADEGGPSMRAQSLEVSLLSKANSPIDKVSVEVFYQFQCPHCVEFLTKELRQVWEDAELRTAIEVKLYPEDFPMECCREGDSGCMGSHKGLNSCLGSRVELCAADILKNSTKHVPFVLCMASHGHRANVEMTSQDCAEKHGISMEEIRTCVNSRKGFDLMLSVADKSATVNSDFIPWVMINGQHAANNALLPALCHELESRMWFWQARPRACSALQDDQSDDEEGSGCNKKHPCLFTNRSSNVSNVSPF